MSHLKVVAHTIATDILSDNVHAQTAYRMVCSQWHTTIELQAENPFEIPAYKSARFPYLPGRHERERASWWQWEFKQSAITACIRRASN